MTQTADGGFTIVGRTLSISDNADIFVINVNSTGDVNWTQTIGSSGGGGDVAWSVTPSLNNDGCVVTGYMGALNLVAVKLDNSGTIVWQKTYAGSNSGGIQGKAIISSSQGYVITGFTGSKNGDIVASKGGEDMIVLRLDANGNKISSDVLGGNGSDIGRNLITTPDGAFVAVAQTTSTSGDVSGNHGLNDVWVVKFKF